MSGALTKKSYRASSSYRATAALLLLLLVFPHICHFLREDFW